MSIHSDAKKTDSLTKGKDQVSRFHMRQAFYILVAFTVLVASLFIMLAEQYSLAQKHKKEVLLRHFKERIAYLDNLVSGVTEHVDGMRIAAEANLFQSSTVEVFNQPVEFKDLTEAANEKRYNLDTFKLPISQKMIGNLTGEGSIQNRNIDFYREICMALSLNPLFRAAAKAIKGSAWAYYTSRENFINIYPWIASKDFKFSKQLFTHEFYTLGLPQNNPDRKRFWTKLYVDEYGKGLMTTCAAPVYDHDRFIGTVAIDLTVEFLNTVVKRFNQKKGLFFLVNNRDQLVAYSEFASSNAERKETLSSALPETLRNSIDGLMRIPENEITRIASFNILRSGLHQAPWQVIYIENADSFWSSITELVGIGSITVLLMLLILGITAFAVTQRQFILPSKRFVNYIMDRSRGIRTQTDHKLPRVWKAWFGAVEKVFAENEKLTQALQVQNEDLEHRVNQRTAELEKQIEERNQIQDTLRKSEERFRDISYSMADCIWELDADGKYTFISETAKQIIGYDPEELIGKTPFDLMPEKEARRAAVIFGRIVSGKKSIVDLKTWALSKEGEKVCLLTNGLPILNKKGKLIGYRGVGKDVTDADRAEQEKIRLQVQLQRAEKMESIGTLAGGVAHDLNNILCGIVSYPDLLLMQLPQESPLREPIETIRKTGIKSAAIVQDLLTLARRGVAATEIVNLNAIITEYLESPEHKKLKSFHPEVRVKTDLEKDLMNIMGSPVHISKTVMNLVSNAAEAMPGGGKVIISTENRYIDTPVRRYDEVKEGDYATITVSDSGVGISSEDKDKIFEPFYTKKVMGRSGTGLGMAVVWGTVKDHKGYIDIQSAPKKGTLFTLYFPVTRKQLSKDGYELAIDEYKGNGESILVVDDVKEQREVAALIFSQLGYRVTAVSSGEEAVEHIKINPTDLLVIDMIMDPGIDGLETYRRILEICPIQKAIIASGFSETERVKEMQGLGAGRYVKKPYTLEKIGIAVKEELSGMTR